MSAEAGPSTAPISSMVAHSSRSASSKRSSRRCAAQEFDDVVSSPLSEDNEWTSLACGLPPTEDASLSSSPSASSASSVRSSVVRGSNRTASRNRPSWSWTTLLGMTMAMLVFASGLVQAQDDATDITGTWSSGSGAVQTGLKFFNPGTGVFSYPTAAGQSYSFTDDGHWEQALYIYETNPAKPSCVSAQLIWQHGTYKRYNNGSILLTPFKGDGRQQISDRCASESNVVQPYNQQETMANSYIRLDMHYGKPAYSLQLFEFDGVPKPLMWQIYNPPQMLPTEQLHVEIIGSTAG